MSLSESGDKLDFEFDAVAASGVRRRSRHTIALFDPWCKVGLCQPLRGTSCSRLVQTSVSSSAAVDPSLLPV